MGQKHGPIGLAGGPGDGGEAVIVFGSGLIAKHCTVSRPGTDSLKQAGDTKTLRRYRTVRRTDPVQW